MPQVLTLTDAPATPVSYVAHPTARMECIISNINANSLHAQGWRSRPAVVPTGHCTSSAAELASRPTPPALRLFQAECHKARKPPTRRSVQASAAFSAPPILPTEGSAQSKQDQPQTPTRNGHLSSNSSNSNQASAPSAAAAAIASQTVQAESLALLEWPEVCQQASSCLCQSYAAPLSSSLQLRHNVAISCPHDWRIKCCWLTHQVSLAACIGCTAAVG